MTKLPGDPDYAKLLGFPGLEAIIKVLLDKINELQRKAGFPETTHDEIKTLALTKTSDLAKE